MSKMSVKQRIKHPLQYTWTFWYFKPEPGRNWADCLQELYSFETVEDFWNLYNHLLQPDQISINKDYNFFKKGIRPEWEDKMNENGGIFYLQAKPNDRINMNVVWKELLMCMIGDGFEEHSPYINGISYNARQRADRISVWVMYNAQKDKQKIFQVETRLRYLLEKYIENGHKMQFTYKGNDVQYRNPSVSNSGRNGNGRK